MTSDTQSGIAERPNAPLRLWWQWGDGSGIAMCQVTSTSSHVPYFLSLPPCTLQKACTYTVGQSRASACPPPTLCTSKNSGEACNQCTFTSWSNASPKQVRITPSASSPEGVPDSRLFVLGEKVGSVSRQRGIGNENMVRQGEKGCNGGGGGLGSGVAKKDT